MTTEHLPQPVPRPEPGNLVAAIERVERAVASATELPALTEVHACISALEHLSKTMNLAREQLNRLAESRIRALPRGHPPTKATFRGTVGSESRPCRDGGGSSTWNPASRVHDWLASRARGAAVESAERSNW